MATVKLVNDAQALQSMRASDFDARSAYGEVVDNSLQAEAKNVRVEVDYDSGRGGAKLIRYVAFGDDGWGMSSDELQRCMQLGYSSRFNDRTGIGRFGVGVTLAAINQCKRVEVYSKERGGTWLFTHIDLDQIASGSRRAYPLRQTRNHRRSSSHSPAPSQAP